MLQNVTILFNFSKLPFISFKRLFTIMHFNVENFALLTGREMSINDYINFIMILVSLVLSKAKATISHIP